MPLTIRKNLQIGLFISEFYMQSIFSTYYSVVCSNHPRVFKIQLFIPNFETRFMYTSQWLSSSAFVCILHLK